MYRSRISWTRGHGVAAILITVAFLSKVSSGQSIQSPGLLITEYNAVNESSYVRYIGGDLSSINAKEDFSDSMILIEDTPSRKVGISYDFNDSLLFWADTLRQSVVKYSLLDGSWKTLYHANTSYPEDLAVDWSANNVYLADSANRQIVMCDYMGNCLPIVTEIENLLSVAVEPNQGYLYWSTKGSSPKIERASLSGTNRMTVVSPHTTVHGIINTPLGIVTGYSKRFEETDPVHRIFWLDQAEKTFLSANLDGTETQVDFQDASYKNLVDLDLTTDVYIVSDFEDGQVRLVKRAFPGEDLRIRFAGETPTSAVYFDNSRQTTIPGRETTTTLGVTAPPGGVPRTLHPALTKAETTPRTTAKTGVTYVTLAPETREGASGGISALHVGLIIGGIILLLLVIFAIVFVLCLLRKRKKRESIKQERDHQLNMHSRPLPDEPVYAFISEQDEEVKAETPGTAPPSGVYQPLLKSNADDDEKGGQKDDDTVRSDSEQDYSYQKVTFSDQESNHSPGHSYINVNDQSADVNPISDNSEYVPMESGHGGSGKEGAGDVHSDDGYYQPGTPHEGDGSGYAYPNPEDEVSEDYDNQNPKNEGMDNSELEGSLPQNAEPYITVLPDPSTTDVYGDKMSDSDSITYC